MVAAVLTTACGTFVRTDSLAGPIYAKCMDGLDAQRSDREEDRQCVEHARSTARAIMDQQGPTDTGADDRDAVVAVDADAERGRSLTRCKAGDDAACSRLGLARRSPPAPPHDPPASSSTDAAANGDSARGEPPPSSASNPKYVLPKADFPDSVAGFRFGATPVEIVKACKAGGAKPFLVRPGGVLFKVAETIDGDAITCDGRPPVDPFVGVNVVERVFIHFCKESGDKVPLACRVDIDFAQHDAKAAVTLAEKLEAKYGPLTGFAPAFECRTKSGRDVAFTGSWFWLAELDGQRLPAGHLMLNYACTPVVPAPEIFLVYRDMVATYREFFSRRGADF